MFCSSTMFLLMHGTAEGMVKLVEKAGGKVSGMGFIAELTFLDGKSKLSGIDTTSLIQL